MLRRWERGRRAGAAFEFRIEMLDGVAVARALVMGDPRTQVRYLNTPVSADSPH